MTDRRICRLLVSILALVFVSSPAFSKGKKPPQDRPIEFDRKAFEDLPVEPGSSYPSAPLPDSLPAVDAPKFGADKGDDLEPSVEAEAQVAAPLAPPASVVDEPPQVAPEGSKVHQVWIWQETRDCLWKLAKTYYNDPWKWKKIYLANRNGILDPAVIFPKQQLIIPPAEY